MTIDEIKTALEHSPAEPGRIAEGLIGWTDTSRTVCSTCAGRLGGRGVSVNQLFNAKPSGIWRADKSISPTPPCGLCGKSLRATQGGDS